MTAGLETARRVLVLGGTRSGKSRQAEMLAAGSGLEVVYVATARALDAEMAARIETHRARRPADWRTVEAPLALADRLRREARPDRCLLVDCLALWLNNLLMSDDPERLDAETSTLLQTLPGLPGRLVLVGNESNMGMTPLGELSRRYADHAGLLHQALAEACDAVVLCVAGLPLRLK